MLLQKFPDNVATVYSITEASFSFAEMLGPTFGAILYEYGGFYLPFVICGSLCLLTGIMTIFILPKDISLSMDEGDLAIVEADSSSLDDQEILT